MIMNWTYPKGDDASGCRRATCYVGDDTYEYYGQWYDDQPCGLGAIRKNGQFFKASHQWIKGKTTAEEELDEIAYENAMQSYQNQFRYDGPHW